MTAVELDDRVVGALRDIAPSASVTVADALAVDWREELTSITEPRAIVSNMPYNITGPLLTKVAECHDLIESAVLMMQREVAEKIVAQVGDRNRGSISVFLQLLFVIEPVCKVPPGAFAPPPKVDSMVLKLVPTGREIANEAAVFRTVRAGFSQPRKTVVNNLSSLLGKGLVKSELVKLGYSETVRPHEIKLLDWITLGGLIES